MRNRHFWSWNAIYIEMYWNLCLLSIRNLADWGHGFRPDYCPHMIICRTLCSNTAILITNCSDTSFAYVLLKTTILASKKCWPSWEYFWTSWENSSIKCSHEIQSDSLWLSREGFLFTGDDGTEWRNIALTLSKLIRLRWTSWLVDIDNCMSLDPSPIEEGRDEFLDGYFIIRILLSIIELYHILSEMISINSPQWDILAMK